MDPWIIGLVGSRLNEHLKRDTTQQWFAPKSTWICKYFTNSSCNLSLQVPLYFIQMGISHCFSFLSVSVVKSLWAKAPWEEGGLCAVRFHVSVRHWGQDLKQEQEAESMRVPPWGVRLAGSCSNSLTGLCLLAFLHSPGALVHAVLGGLTPLASVTVKTMPSQTCAQALLTLENPQLRDINSLTENIYIYIQWSISKI